jgi:hypothetical protein
MNIPRHLDDFREAFQTDVSRAEFHCHCGRIFFDNYNGGIWDDEKEIEELRNNPEATAIDHSIGTLEVEGKEFCWECDCWHKRAEQVRGFLLANKREIAELFRREKIRLQESADAIPSIS